jgi:hypothetical protein
MKSKQQIKFVVFNYKIPIAPLTLPKTMCLRIFLCFPKTFPFGQSQVTSPWSKNNKNSKFKLTMFHDQPLFKCLIHPNHVFILPPLYFGFRPWSRCKMTKNEMKLFHILLNICLFYRFCSFNLYNNQWFCTHL